MKPKYLTFVNWFWIIMNGLGIILVIYFDLINLHQYTNHSLGVLSAINQDIYLFVFPFFLLILNLVFYLYWKIKKTVEIKSWFMISLSFLSFCCLFDLSLMIAFPTAYDTTVLAPYKIAHHRMIVNQTFRMAAWQTYFMTHQLTIFKTLVLDDTNFVAFNGHGDSNNFTTINDDVYRLLNQTVTINVYEWKDNLLHFVQPLTINFSFRFATHLIGQYSLENSQVYDVTFWVNINQTSHFTAQINWLTS